MFYLTAPSIQTNQKRKEVRDRSAEYEKVEDKVIISFESADRIEDCAERIDRAAEDKQAEKEKCVRVTFVNRIEKKNAHPAKHHVKHHLKLFVFFLIYKRQRNSERSRYNTDRNADNGKRSVIGEYIENHQRNACARNQNKYNRMVNKSCNFFCFSRGKSMINRRAAVKNNHSRSENY